MTEAKNEFGVVGLGRMGGDLALQALEKGMRVVGSTRKGAPDDMLGAGLVEALTRAGRGDEAQLIFEQMLGYSNHLGLYAEEIGPTGEALGNFPQAFTHLTLISAAFSLNRVLGAGSPG